MPLCQLSFCVAGAGSHDGLPSFKAVTRFSLLWRTSANSNKACWRTATSDDCISLFCQGIFIPRHRQHFVLTSLGKAPFPKASDDLEGSYNGRLALTREAAIYFVARCYDN